MSFKGVFTQAANLAEKKECHTLSIDFAPQVIKIDPVNVFPKTYQINHFHENDLGDATRT